MAEPAERPVDKGKLSTRSRTAKLHNTVETSATMEASPRLSPASPSQALASKDQQHSQVPAKLASTPPVRSHTPGLLSSRTRKLSQATASPNSTSSKDKHTRHRSHSTSSKPSMLASAYSTPRLPVPADDTLIKTLRQSSVTAVGPAPPHSTPSMIIPSATTSVSSRSLPLRVASTTAPTPSSAPPSSGPGSVTSTTSKPTVNAPTPITRWPAPPNPATAPDVKPAPASGMYWSLALTCGAPRAALRAHTTTLIGSNLYIFGGCNSSTCFNGLYMLDCDSFTWSKPKVHGTVPLPLRAMTCTAVGKKLVVFGGGDGPAYYNDVYILDTLNFRWSKPKIHGDARPSKRRAHTACLYRSGIYVFGGGDGVRALNDIWRLDVSDMNKLSWNLVSENSATSNGSSSTTLQADTSRPRARGYHTANMVGSKLVVFGGSDGGECFRDVWIYDIDSGEWRSPTIEVSYPRLSHTATIVGSYLFVIGGHDGVEYSNEVLLLNLVTMQWDQKKVYGKPPSGRGYHGAVLSDSRVLVIGGFDGSTVFDQCWILELAVHSYYSQISHFSIDV